jgi:DNA-directed RNA polymerase specialized sigma24 family protein
MPPDSVDRGKRLPETAAGQEPGGGPEPETVASGSALLKTTPGPGEPLRPPEPPPPEPFPYARVLAYHRRQLRDPLEVAQVEAALNASPRWRAHLESVQFLDLERAAALQDGADLRAFSVEAAGQLCLYAAVSDGELFARAARFPGGIREETRRVWARHTRACVYCRRMRRRAVARLEAERAGLPQGEVLLREWLLGRYYADVLAERTEEVIQTFRRKNLRELVKRLAPEQEALVVEHVVKKVPLEELARAQGRPVSALRAQVEEAIAHLPRLYHESILAEIEQTFPPAPDS